MGSAGGVLPRRILGAGAGNRPGIFPMKEPIAELLQTIDALIIAWATGEKEPRERVIKARRAVGETVASDRQLLAVLEQQIASLFRPVVNEGELCEMLRCDPSWLHKERKAGRWLNFEVDARGRRHYTPEQILSNLRNETPKQKLKAA
jgi:hypothetical protein